MESKEVMQAAKAFASIDLGGAIINDPKLYKGFKAGVEWAGYAAPALAARVQLLEEALKKALPILSEAIERAPTGSYRNRICDLQIKLRTALNPQP